MKRMLEQDRPALPTVALVCGAQRIIVDRDRVVIGRSAKEAQLVLRHEAVSRQHAIVERLGAVFWLVDMASTNGVVVNGKRATRAIIGPGDVLSIGPFTIAVERA
jgi:pSer/pThr/pTyr-binding forkhead associated (FHA) protein